MPRPTTKTQLQEIAQINFEKLFLLIDSIPSHIQEMSFAYNERDETLKDVLVHLYEWQILLLNFIHSNLNKNSNFIPFLPLPYNFKTYPKMNQAIKERHSATSLKKAKALLHKSHKESMQLISTLPDESLFIKNIINGVEVQVLVAIV